jgi:hypothetical protein
MASGAQAVETHKAAATQVQPAEAQMQPTEEEAQPAA